MARVRRSRYVCFFCDDFPFLDVGLLLRGTIETDDRSTGIRPVGSPWGDDSPFGRRVRAGDDDAFGRVGRGVRRREGASTRAEGSPAERRGRRGARAVRAHHELSRVWTGISRPRSTTSCPNGVGSTYGGSQGRTRPTCCHRRMRPSVRSSANSGRRRARSTSRRSPCPFVSCRWSSVRAISMTCSFGGGRRAVSTLRRTPARRTRGGPPLCVRVPRLCPALRGSDDAEADEPVGRRIPSRRGLSARDERRRAGPRLLPLRRARPCARAHRATERRRGENGRSRVRLRTDLLRRRYTSCSCSPHVSTGRSGSTEITRKRSAPC